MRTTEKIQIKKYTITKKYKIKLEGLLEVGYKIGGKFFFFLGGYTFACHWDQENLVSQLPWDMVVHKIVNRIFFNILKMNRTMSSVRLFFMLFKINYTSLG